MTGGTARKTPLVELGEVVLDPADFASGLLGHDLWETQSDILRALSKRRARVAVKSCHASSKTFTAADATIWWPVRFPDGIVVTTAPTWTQVEKLLWGHVHQAVRGGRISGLPKLHATEFKLGPDNYAIGLSTNEGVRFQGWHGTVLIVLDEAPGVRAEIYEAIEGIRAGGDVRVLLLGQPMVIGGHFYDAFHGKRTNWETFTISAFNTPNLQGCYLDNGKKGDERVRIGNTGPGSKNLLRMTKEELETNERPYLITRDYVVEKWHEWGETGSPLWEVKVLGQFPRQVEGALFLLEWIEAAERIIPGFEADPLDVGIDVAGPGEDETVVSIRQGPNRIALKWWLKPDPRGDVVDYLRPYKDRIRALNVDSAGDGYYFALHLRDKTGGDYGKRVRLINVGKNDGIDLDRFTNQKGAYYWSLRERAREGRLGGITDPVEQGQLTALRYEHDSQGRVVIEDKEDMKARVPGLKSPDRAEADMLAFAPPAIVHTRRIIAGSTSYANIPRGRR